MSVMQRPDPSNGTDVAARVLAGAESAVGQIARLPRGYVPRYRFWKQLDVATLGAVTVVVAPAGAGKTLGVAGWLQGGDRRPGVELDQSLLHIWIIADSSWDEHRLRELLDHTITGRDNSDVDDQNSPGRPLIIIDDAHKLPLSALRLIGHRLDSAPESLHVLLLSRWDLLMGNLGSQLLGNLITLRGDLLRLDDQEAEALIRQHARTEDIDVIQSIQQRAGGWCAVVVLAARAIGAMSDPREAWQRYMSEGVPIADRVMTEVFSTLSSRERHLLLCVAQEEVTTENIAVHLSRDDRAGEILETLESTGLLVTRIGPAWDGSSADAQYRIHPLLVEVVRRRLSAGGVDVEQARATVVRAVRLDIDGGQVVTAFDRLMAIREYDSAAELLATDGFIIWARGHAPEIDAFAQQHPDIIAQHPGTWFVVAIARWFEGDVMSAQRWMSRVLKASGDEPHLAVRVACMRLMLARLGFEPVDVAAEDAQRLLTTLEMAVDVTPVNTAELALLCTELGITQNWLGDLAHAESNLRAAIGLCRSRGLPLETALALSHLALTEYMSGREHTARQVAQEALAASAESRQPLRRYISARASLVLSQCRYVDLPRLDRRAPHVAVEETHHQADLCTEFWFHMHAARVRMLDRDLDGAARCLDAPLNLPVLSELPAHLSVSLIVERGFIAALAGDEEVLKDLQHQLASSAFAGEAALLAGIRADLDGDRREAAALFKAAADDTTSTQLATTRAFALVCEAQLLDALGDREQAIRRLQLATTETAVRRNSTAFLGWARQGSPVKALIDELQRRSPTRWGEEIATAAGLRPDVTLLFASETATVAEQFKTPTGIVAPKLSAREREVLRELARGSTYADMSANLFITENTVKTHVSSLYGKLSASRRSEALAIARSLHLL
jgi:LuxR family transcriptional regulator, maltose regulon positive regulatory protein